MNIEISISGPKGYVGRITGADSKYGFSLEFLPKKSISRTLHAASITEPGQYKVSEGAVVAARRIDTGYIRVTEDGAVTEIEKIEVVL